MRKLQIIFVLLIFGGMTFAQSPTSISFDFSSNAQVCENVGGGTTTVPVGDPINTDGLAFTGQVGPWNALIAGRGQLFACCSESPSITADGLTFTLNTNNNFYENFIGSGTDNLRKNVIFFRNTGVRCQGPNQANTELTWSISDLNPRALYSLVLFGQAQPTAVNPSNFSIDDFDAGNGIGMPVTLDTENDGNFIDVRPDATGTITGRFAYQPGQGTGETFSGWAGLQIQESGSIPTMSQWALIILGLILTSLAVVRIRRVVLA